MKVAARPSTLVGLSIVAIAAILRLGWLDLAPYQYDEADVLLRIFEMRRGTVPLSGAMTSWGVPDPPLMVYIIALVSWLPYPALAAAGVVALFGVAAVAMTYVMALRHFGFWVALTSALLFAVNPWAVYFGRRFWTEILPLFSILAFWAALEVTQRRDPRWLPILGAALALQIQTRLLGGLYVPAAFVTVVPVAYHWVRSILLTLGMALAVSAPFLIYIAGSYQDLTKALREGSRGLTISANTGLWDLVRWTISGQHLLPFENRGLSHLSVLASAMVWVEIACVGLLVLGMALALFFWARRESGWGRFPSLILWTVTPMGLLAAQTSSLYLHYLVVLYPFPFLVMGLVLGGAFTPRRDAIPGGPVGRWLRAGGRALAALVLCGIVVVQFGLTLGLYSVLKIYDVRDDERAAPPAQPQAPAALLAASGPRDTAQSIGTGETYGIEIPMKYWLEVRKVSHRLAREMGVRDIMVFTDGANPLAEERPALVEAMIGPELRGRYLSPTVQAFPLGRPLLVMETWAMDPAESFQRLGERLETVPLPTSSRTARDATRFYALPARTAHDWSLLAGNPLNSTMGGLTLVGARGPERVRSGESIQFVTFWVGQPGSTISEEPVTVRLLDERGQRIAAKDLELPRSLYELNDAVGIVMRHDLSVSNRTPAGNYQFEVSLGVESARAARTEVSGR